MTQLTIALTREEMEKLRRAAKADLRHPREQARYLLRRVLLGETVQENSNSDAIRQDSHVAVVGIVQ